MTLMSVFGWVFIILILLVLGIGVVAKLLIKTGKKGATKIKEVANKRRNA